MIFFFLDNQRIAEESFGPSKRCWRRCWCVSLLSLFTIRVCINFFKMYIYSVIMPCFQATAASQLKAFDPRAVSIVTRSDLICLTRPCLNKTWLEYVFRLLQMYKPRSKRTPPF